MFREFIELSELRVYGVWRVGKFFNSQLKNL